MWEQKQEGLAISDPFEWDNQIEDEDQLLKEFRRNYTGINDLESAGPNSIKKVTSIDIVTKKYDLRKQPIFHQRNRGLGERLCCCLTEKCNLTRREVKHFYYPVTLFSRSDIFTCSRRRWFSLMMKKTSIMRQVI